MLKPILVQGTNVPGVRIHSDSILVEKVDASDFFLVFYYGYVAGDTAATKKIAGEAKAFLKSHKLPQDGKEEMFGASNRNMDSLMVKYDSVLTTLRDSPQRELYRRVVGSMVVKYLCSENKLAEANLLPPHNKLVYFLNEMKEGKAHDVELVYTAFLKFQYRNSYHELCKALGEFSDYFQEGVSYSEKQVQRQSSSKVEGKEQKALDFVLGMYNQILDRRKEYWAELQKLKEVTCK